MTRSTYSDNRKLVQCQNAEDKYVHTEIKIQEVMNFFKKKKCRNKKKSLEKSFSTGPALKKKRKD